MRDLMKDVIPLAGIGALLFVIGTVRFRKRLD